MRKSRLTIFLSGALLCCCVAASAQQPATPSAQQIADALTPKPADAAPVVKPARKTRNLSVEDVPAGEAEAAPSPPPSGPPSINLAIQFDLNSDRLQPTSVTLLNSLAEALQSPPLRQTRFLVEGHTDGTGQPAYNKRLSAQRAAQVKRVLVQRHVDPARIVTEGKGSSELLNTADPGAAENRRVRVVMLER